jgi:hypothetical protein
LGGVEWIHPAQDRDRWRAVVNAVMNLRVLAHVVSCDIALYTVLDYICFLIIHVPSPSLAQIAATIL